MYIYIYNAFINGQLGNDRVYRASEASAEVYDGDQPWVSSTTNDLDMSVAMCSICRLVS